MKTYGICDHFIVIIFNKADLGYFCASYFSKPFKFESLRQLQEACYGKTFPYLTSL